MVADVPTPLAILDAPAAPGLLVPRRERFLAAAADLASALPMITIAVGVAAAWLLVRTGAGREDARGLDAAIALAVVGAVPPAWLARLALGLLDQHATPGQHARGLRVEATRTRAVLVRLALHPFGAVGWAWLAGIAALAQSMALAGVLGAVAALVLVAGGVSLAMILVAPGAPTLHDRLAGTRLVRA